MIPNKEGIWEWFEADGTKRLMSVFNIGHDPYPPLLRVYWWGGYYNVSQTGDALWEGREWPDRWGQWVGENGSIPEEQLYNGPTPEQREKILAQIK